MRIDGSAKAAADAAALAGSVTDAVAAERRHAETLLYRLTTAKLLLGAGETGLLARALAELELVSAQLDTAGAMRQEVVGALAVVWGLDPLRVTLPDLVAQVEDPWCAALAAEDGRLRLVTPRIAAAAAADRALAETALDFVRRRLGTGPRAVAEVGHPRELDLVRELGLAPVVTELRVQEVVFEAVIEAAAETVPGRLLAFLGPGPETE